VSIFEGSTLAKHPRAAMFEASRDALPLAVAHVDDIDRVAVQNRIEHPDGTVELTNLWRASMPIPESIQGIVKPEMLVWTDHSVWTSADHTCRWQVVSHYFPDNVRCAGYTRYEEAMRGQGTRVALFGEVSVDPRGVQGLPPFAQHAIARGLEEFVCAMFPWGLRKVVDAVSRHLSELEQPRW
jgi:hypothetical protein